MMMRSDSSSATSALLRAKDCAGQLDDVLCRAASNMALAVAFTST